MPTFRNHVSVPSSKAGSRLCGVREGKAIYIVAGNGTGASQANGVITTGPSLATKYGKHELLHALCTCEITSATWYKVTMRHLESEFALLLHLR